MKKHPIKMLFRVLRCLFAADQSASLVQKSYDRLSPGYDNAWTHHMRSQTEQLIRALNLKQGDTVIDLTCGTGYATHLIHTITCADTTGVDQSRGMLEQARNNVGPAIRFIQSDALAYLKTVPTANIDAVTCCWGLGYTRPLQVLRQIRRVLKPTGKVAIIDNSIFSLFEVLRCSFLAFMESPQSLRNIMRFRFLTGPTQLNLWFRLAGLKPKQSWSGRKTYSVSTGAEAINRLRATGAAAGFEYAANPADDEKIFARFAEILEQKYRRNNRIDIHHRFLAGIAQK